jgi:transposase
LFLQKESEMPNPKPPYPAQFREQMVELVRAGRRPGELAKEFGYHVTSILSWVRMADEAIGAAPAQSVALSTSERQELVELRRKLRTLTGDAADQEIKRTRKGR